MSSGRRRLALLATLVVSVLALTAAPALATPPIVTVPVVSNVTYTSVHLTSTVDPLDTNVYWSFQTSPDGVTWTPFSTQGIAEVNPDNPGPQNVEANLEGLKGGTTYFVRLATINFVDSGEGSEEFSPGPNPEFTTLAVDSPEVLSVADASAVSIVTAKASGKIKRPANPDPAFNTDCRFEYISDAKYAVQQDEVQELTVGATGGSFQLEYKGQKSAQIAFDASAATVQSALEALPGFPAGALTVSGGPGDENATTPYILTFGGTQANTNVALIHSDGAGLSGDTTAINVFASTQGRAVGFEGATPIPCGIEPLSTPEEEKEVEATLTGLLPATEYHLRLTAFNSGPDASLEAADTFTTDPATAPVIALNPPSGVLSSKAHISGTIDPEGGNVDTSAGPLPILWQLQINLEGAGWELREAGTIEADQAKSTDPITVPADLSNLQPNSEYKFRLIVSYVDQEAITPEGSFETEGVIAPTVSSLAVSELAGTSARLSAKVNPNGADPLFNTAWHFHCTPSCGEPGGTVVADGSEHTISSAVADLEPNTAYQVELAASNTAGADQEGPVSFKTLTLPPSVQTGYATDVEATSATIAAKLNPRNSEVSYQFEYGTDESYGTAIPIPAASLTDADNTLHVLTQPLTGLAEDTTYHFRLTATNTEADPDETTHGVDHTFTTPPASGPKACPNQQLRAENSSLALPDCRAYEMVSPLQKSGNNVANRPSQFGPTDAGFAQSTPEGNGVVYFTQGSVGDANSGLSFYSTSRRGEDGWSTRSALPPGDLERKEVTHFAVFQPTFTPQLDRAIWTTEGAWLSEMPESPDAQSSSEYLGSVYLGSPDGSIEWISRPDPQVPDPKFDGNPATILGASPSLGTFYFYFIFNPQPLLPSVATHTIYEYSSQGLRSVAALPGGSELPGGSAPANVNSPDYDPKDFTSPNTTRGQVSRDGSILYFVSSDPAPGAPTELYVRRGGISKLVSHDEGGDQAPTGVVAVGNAFQTYGGSYQYVYGSPDGDMAIFQSRDALVSAAPDDGSLKAYRYDVATDALSYLPGVGGMVAAASSDDGETFLMSGAGKLAVSDHGQVSQIAAVGSGSGEIGVGNLIPARATPSGSAFVFLGQGIPGFNDEAGNPNAPREVFRYDVADAQLSCLSCPPDGIAPAGSASFGSNIGGLVPNPIISEDANRVFFESPDSLLPADTDGVRDVYEWTPGGLSLISTGHSKADSFVVANSTSGNDVFFSTKESIDPADTDELYDVYDARVGGGFPRTAAVSPCDTDDSCKNISPPRPERPGLATESPLPQSEGGPTAKIKVNAHQVIKGAPKLQFNLSGPGTVAVTANGLKAARHFYKEAGSYELKLALKPPSSKGLRENHRLKLRVHLRFSPASGESSFAKVVLTVKG